MYSIVDADYQSFTGISDEMELIRAVLWSSSMRKEDLTTGNIICEAVGVVATLIYTGLQIYCGILYGAEVMTIITNIVMVALIYIGMVILTIYPEKVNRLEPEICTGKVRQLTIHMLLYVKLVFVLSLLFTSVCDVLGRDVDGAYSLISVGFMVIIAIGYEIKIFQILKRES